MSFAESLPNLLLNVASFAVHAGVFIVGLMLLQRVKSWGAAVGIASGVIVVNVLLSLATYLLQGWERASQLILPSGDMFPFVTLPMILGTAISTLMTMLAVYGLFVEPRKKHV
jgi:hypothetical protein